MFNFPTASQIAEAINQALYANPTRPHFGNQEIKLTVNGDDWQVDVGSDAQRATGEYEAASFFPAGEITPERVRDAAIGLINRLKVSMNESYQPEIDVNIGEQLQMFDDQEEKPFDESLQPLGRKPREVAGQSQAFTAEQIAEYSAYFKGRPVVTVREVLEGAWFQSVADGEDSGVYTRIEKDGEPTELSFTLTPRMDGWSDLHMQVKHESPEFGTMSGSKDLVIDPDDVFEDIDVIINGVTRMLLKANLPYSPEDEIDYSWLRPNIPGWGKRKNKIAAPQTPAPSAEPAAVETGLAGSAIAVADEPPAEGQLFTARQNMRIANKLWELYAPRGG